MNFGCFMAGRNSAVPRGKENIQDLFLTPFVSMVSFDKQPNIRSNICSRTVTDTYTNQGVMRQRTTTTLRMNEVHFWHSTVRRRATWERVANIVFNSGEVMNMFDYGCIADKSLWLKKHIIIIFFERSEINVCFMYELVGSPSFVLTKTNKN